MMTPLISDFKNFLRRHEIFEEDDRVLIAVSGGPDSVALLHLLKEVGPLYKLELAVAHLNHMARGKESDADADFVENLAREMGLPIFIGNFDIFSEQRKLKTSFQESARIIRYKFMEDALANWGGNKVALGHTADDQAETILINFLRGSGALGMGGIPPVRQPYVRPMIQFYRHQITWYLSERKCNFRIDPSNENQRYLRNRVRLDLLPKLESDYNIRMKPNLLDMGEIFREENLFLDECASRALTECLLKRSHVEEIALDRRHFASFHTAIRKRIIREMIRLSRGSIRRLTARHVRSVEQLALSGVHGKRLCLPDGFETILKGEVIIFRRTPNNAFSVSKNESFLKPTALKIPGQTTEFGVGIVIQSRLVDSTDRNWKSAPPTEAWLDFEKTGAGLNLRSPLPGDSFIPLGMSGRKKLKSYFIDEKIPREKRPRTPVLTNADGDIIWIYGGRIAHQFRVSTETRRILHLVGSDIDG